MTPAADDRRVRRILVTLDGTEINGGTMERAARLALALEAELFGLLTEDPNLAALADHVGVVFQSVIGRTAHDDTALLRRALRVRREQTQRAIEETGRRVGVRTDFQVFSGRPEDALSAGGLDADLVFLGLEMIPRGDIAVAFDGGDTAHRALDTAVGLAGAEGVGVIVLLATARVETARQWEAELRSRTGLGANALDFVVVPDASLTDLARLAHRRGAALMVIDRQSPWLVGAPIQPGGFEVPLLLVR